MKVYIIVLLYNGIVEEVLAFSEYTSAEKKVIELTKKYYDYNGANMDACLEHIGNYTEYEIFVFHQIIE